MRARPTHALVRAVAVAAAALIVVVVTGQPALLVVAGPFVLWATAAAVRRPRPESLQAEATLSARRVMPGQWVELAVTGAPGIVVDAGLAPPPDADLDPRWGSVCARDEPATIRIRPHRWGSLTLGGARVTLSDPWGAWTADTTVALGDLTVTPAPALPGRGDALTDPIGMAGLHRSARRGDGSDLADVRPFAPGDKLRRINWRVTSRTGVLHANTTLGERDTDVLVLVDTIVDATTAELSADVPFASSLDETVAAAASLIEHYLRLGDRVGLHDLGDMVGSVPLRTGRRQFAVVMDRLARARPQPGFGDAVRPVRRVRPGTSVIACTPLLTGGVVAELARLAQEGRSVLVVDTLPAALGAELPPRRSLWHAVTQGRRESFWDEAWVLRRRERARDVARLRALGVATVSWRGADRAGAVAAVLAARPAPRLRRGTGGPR